MKTAIVAGELREAREKKEEGVSTYASPSRRRMMT
jgi:hypothetical protein